jgi:aminoglycoside phosphotransferase (APT) family kinase protein
MMSSAARRAPSHWYLGIDRRLPQLPKAFDLPAVSRLYEKRWHGRAEGLGVRARKVHNVDYRPSPRCTVAHELTVERGGDGSVETIGVVDVRPAGLRLRLFYQDADLPWLADAADPVQVGRRLAALELAPGSRIVRVVPVRYRPGARCLLRFDLEAGSHPATLYGKVLATDGHRLSSALSALRAIDGRRGAPRVLQPLGYVSDLHMLLLPAVAGSEFHRLAFDTTVAPEERLQWMRKAGAALAGLHAEPLPAAPERRLTDDAAYLAEFSTAVARAVPSLAPAFEEAIRLLRCATHEEPPAVVSHGSFRSDQLLIEGDEPLMIDLDGLCSANPARDVGNFLAYLRWKSIREPHHSSFIEAAIPSFLAGYGSVRTLPDERWTARYEAGSMLKIAGRRLRKLDVSEWPLLPQLLDEARVLLGLPSPAAASHAAVHAIPASVRAALEVEGMTGSLRPLLGPFGDGGAAPVVTRADLVWHKRDHRWTIRYTLDGDGGALLGKIYRDTARGRRVHEIMRWLWDQAASGSPELSVPRPLGWIPELSMLVYRPALGRVLGDAIFDARAAAYMDMAAAWLAALHRSRLPLDRAFDVATELANLRVWASVVGNRYPDQARSADRISRRLSELSLEIGAQAARPIHKDFHYEHVFVADRASVIDFDEVRLGDPTFDLAHFCAYLALLGRRVPAMAATLDRLRDEFLASYRRRADWEIGGRFAAFYAYTCLKIAKQLCTASGLLPRPQAEEEHRQTAAMLEEGLAALDRGFRG